MTGNPSTWRYAASGRPVMTDREIEDEAYAFLETYDKTLLTEPSLPPVVGFLDYLSVKSQGNSPPPGRR